MIYDYEYDDQGQITIFNDNSIIYGYSYDKAGNITYRYEDRLLLDGTIVEYDYTYGDSQWGDLLTEFNGNAITYDTIGNPLQYYNGSTFTWKQGRRLDTVSNGSLNVSYDYDENGIRTSKTINGTEHKYILNGSQIVAETWGNHIVIYLYDELGSPVGMVYRNNNMSEDVYETYFFEKNMFGDILAVYNTSGVKQVSYTYDAFGNFTQTVHVSGTKATYNCLLYRGYYHDSETGFYYLNSRYYDPVTCRFINADIPDVLLASPYALTDKNLFAYCDNNPVMREDNGGEFWCAITGTILGAITGAIKACKEKDNILAGIGIGALCGGISGLAVDFAIATGGLGGAAIAFVGGMFSSAAEDVANNLVNGRSWNDGPILYDAFYNGVMNSLSFGMGKTPDVKSGATSVREMFQFAGQNFINANNTRFANGFGKVSIYGNVRWRNFFKNTAFEIFENVSMECMDNMLDESLQRYFGLKAR